MREVPEKRPSALVATTPVPNWLLDEVLPQLGDTQLRVLLVVVRSTRGWQQGRGRKERDWLSHRQLQARTGRSSAVVSRAVDALVKRGLIVVMDAVGEPLLTAQARSRARGRLFYGLAGPMVNEDSVGAEPSRRQDRQEGTSTPAPPISTLESEVKKGRALLPHVDEITRESEVPKAVAASETSPQKVRTTKESGTKEMNHAPSGVISLPIPTLENEVSRLDLGELLTPGENQNGGIRPKASDLKTAGADASMPTDKAGQNFPDATPGDSDGVVISLEMSRFIGVFQYLYLIHRPEFELRPLRREDYALLQKRLAQHSTQELEAWLRPFFACSFGYVRRREWSLGSYLESLTILQMAIARKR